MSMFIGILLRPTARYNQVKQYRPRLVLGWVTVLVCQYLLIVLRDETLNRGSLGLLVRRQYEFPCGIDIVQLSFFFFFNFHNHLLYVSDKVCSEPPVIANAYHNGTAPFYLVGSLVNYTCDGRSVPTSHIVYYVSVCQSDFTWSDPSALVCDGKCEILALYMCL